MIYRLPYSKHAAPTSFKDLNMIQVSVLFYQPLLLTAIDKCNNQAKPKSWQHNVAQMAKSCPQRRFITKPKIPL